MLSSPTITAGKSRGAASPNCRGVVYNLEETNHQAFKARGRQLRRPASCAALMLAVLVLLISQTTTAQLLYGSLTGNVTDPKDFAVPGAKVDVLEVATGATRSTITDDRA